MDDEKQTAEERGFKIIDKRRDGRDEADSSPEPEAPAPEQAPQASKESPPQPAGQAPHEAGQAHWDGKDAFGKFIMSLATSAYLHLGLIADPSGASVEKSLPLAKQTIDILGLLEEKTRGNLDTQEEALLKQLLGELRLQYIKEQKKD